MQSDTFYKTLAAAAETELKEKGSRFIARAAPVDLVQAADAFIADLQKQHYDATHNCYAYIVGRGADAVFRFNDDGEPSGTAGKPILQSIRGRELTNIVVVVTRYFGGIKLGTGGLIRAYGGAAAQVLDAATIKKIYATRPVFLECPYAAIGKIENCLKKNNGKIIQANYGEHVQLTVELREHRVESFVTQIIEITAGTVAPKVLEEI